MYDITKDVLYAGHFKAIELECHYHRDRNKLINYLLPLNRGKRIFNIHIDGTEYEGDFDSIADLIWSVSHVQHPLRLFGGEVPTKGEPSLSY